MAGNGNCVHKYPEITKLQTIHSLFLQGASIRKNHTGDDQETNQEQLFGNIESTFATSNTVQCILILVNVDIVGGHGKRPRTTKDSFQQWTLNRLHFTFPALLAFNKYAHSFHK